MCHTVSVCMISLSVCVREYLVKTFEIIVQNKYRRFFLTKYKCVFTSFLKMTVQMLIRHPTRVFRLALSSGSV